jgi:hypothetical protein
LALIRAKARRPAALDPAGDGRAVLVLALVGVDLGQVGLGELGELVLDLVGAERVVAREEEISGPPVRASR